MTLTPAQAVAAVDSPRLEWDELSDRYKQHCKAIAAAAVAAHLAREGASPAWDTDRYVSGPPGHMRTADGRVAYTTVRAGEVVPGMWVSWRGEWLQVDTIRPIGSEGVDITTGDRSWAHLMDTKVKVATTPEAQRLEAERQAQRAEAYDQACEART